MLSLPNDGRYPTLELDPQQRRQKTLEALTAQLEALSRSNPVLMIFEDVHWIDPTSLEVLGRSVERLKTLRVLLIVSYRPEFEPPWIGRPYVTALTLNRLGERDIADMIDRVTGNKPLPESVRQDLIDRTDGVPLFVEEMTKAVLEAEGGGESAVATIPSPSVGVPASLHASLMARLDRLGRAKEVAQIGAAIGRDFSHSLLRDIIRKPEAELQTALDRLVTAGLLFRQGVPPHASYLFKHALVQDAAYGTLLREPRRALHARIAETLEREFVDLAERQPELLARHFTEAGQIENAARQWGKAGQRSLERSALIEAMEQFARALDQIATLPATPVLRREQIKLQVAIINPLIHVKGYAAPETKAAVQRANLLIEKAELLGEPPEDPLLLFYVLYGSWVANAVASFNGNLARDLAAQCLALAERRGTAAPLVIAHRLMGTSLVYTGNIAEGRAHLDRAVSLYDPGKHRALATRFGHDVRTAALCFRSWALWLLGYPEAALANTEGALKDAREIAQAPTLMLTLSSTAVTNILCGRYSIAGGLCSELATLGERKGAAFWLPFAIILRGCEFALDGEPTEAVRIIPPAINAFRSTGAGLFFPFFLSHLAWAYFKTGQFADAQRSIREALTTLETTMERWFEPEANRVAGEIALGSPEWGPTKAQVYFERALAVARQQQAKSWELRAAMSLARLWRDQGKAQLARELLAPVYGWFTEGFDTLDLKEAKALLEELAA